MSLFKNTVKALISDIETRFGNDSEDITLEFVGSGISQYSVQSYYAGSGLNPVIDLGYAQTLFDPTNSGVSIKGGYTEKFDALYSGLYVTGTITDAGYSGLSNSDTTLATATGFSDPLATGLMFTSGINSVFYMGYSEPFDAIIFENQTGSNICSLDLYYSTSAATGINNYSFLASVSGANTASGMVYDGTNNLSRDGNILIKAPSDWVKTTYPYNGSGYFEDGASTGYYYLRAHKTNSGLGNHGRIVGTAAPISYVRIDAGTNPFILNLTKDIVNEGFDNSYDLKANYLFLTNGNYTDMRVTVSGGTSSSRVNITTGL